MRGGDGSEVAAVGKARSAADVPRRSRTTRGQAAAANAPKTQPVVTKTKLKVAAAASRGSVDFSKLKSDALRKYMRVYEVRGTSLYSSKDILCKAVEQHFAAMVVKEEEVLMDFSIRLRADAG
ncbi:hypothetical protein BSKO_08339 [Bryopsis sp. KO-2023]|nr:hypothetical protein BSKO_08339 [Bryopsis sp. KO-2023]